jgi:hypothetical protein
MEGVPMIWVKLAADVASWSAWLWQHRQQFDPVLQRLGGPGGFAQAAFANPGGALRRVGNALVFGQADGGERVLAFIEQTSPRVEAIEQAVGGLQAGQAALSSSLASLQAVSMVSLGLTALTPIVLVAQFKALKRRLDALEVKFDAAFIAKLRTGLDLVRQGQDFLEAQDCNNAHNRLTAALPFCLETMKYFSELLGGQLNQRKVNREEVQLLARHLAVAIAGVASCQIGLEQDQHAFAQSGQELDLLRQAARWVFHELVARDPASYLLPEMRQHGVTLDSLAGLFQQARDAGALGPAQDASPSGWFEEHRQALVRASARVPRLRKKSWYDALKGQLQQAVAAVEETNRVVGLSRLVEQVRTSGRSTLAVTAEYKRNAARQDAEAFPYMAWGLCPSSA